jgi:hypothetical protein
MSYNGSGTFQINTAGQPVVAGTVISSTAFNSLTSDLANGLTTAITKDGQTTVTANIPLAGYKITGLGAATVGTDAVRYSQIQSGTDKLITVTGTDTLTGSMTPVLTAYAAGNQFSFVAANTNTGAVTINIDGVGVKSITKNGTTALVAGNIVANSVVLIEYDGTRFQLLNVVVTATGDVVGPASSTANAIPTFSGTTGKLLQDNTKVKIVSNNITMDGSTSGTLTIAASAVSGTNTLTFPANTGTAILDYSTPAFRNRIINGAMVIDQRNAGAEINPAVTATYYLDRWRATSSVASKFKIGQNAGAVTPPTGFINYLGLTSLSAYTVGALEIFGVIQYIEGLNVADLDWGTASASPVTVSFWVNSSLTGTFGGSLRNSVSTRSYPFTYTISVANTWEKKTVTIVGDTSGTWLTTNGIGIALTFSIGSGTDRSATAGAWASGNYSSATGATSVVGTNGATFYITGVQLEKGSTATSFDYRSYGTELALCQRYYYRLTPSANASFANGGCVSSTETWAVTYFPVTMRTAPSALDQTGTASDYKVYATADVTCSAVPTFLNGSVNTARSRFDVASGLTAGYSTTVRAATATAYLGWSAEL